MGEEESLILLSEMGASGLIRRRCSAVTQPKSDLPLIQFTIHIVQNIVRQFLSLGLSKTKKKKKDQTARIWRSCHSSNLWNHFPEDQNASWKVKEGVDGKPSKAIVLMSCLHLKFCNRLSTATGDFSGTDWDASDTGRINFKQQSFKSGHHNKHYQRQAVVQHQRLTAECFSLPDRFVLVSGSRMACSYRQSIWGCKSAPRTVPASWQWIQCSDACFLRYLSQGLWLSPVSLSSAGIFSPDGCPFRCVFTELCLSDLFSPCCTFHLLTRGLLRNRWDYSACRRAIPAGVVGLGLETLPTLKNSPERSQGTQLGNE